MKNEFYRKIVEMIDRITKVIAEHHATVDYLIDKMNGELVEDLESGELSDYGKSKLIERERIKYIGKCQASAEGAMIDLKTSFDEIETQLYRWFNSPLDSHFMELATAAKQFGLKLSIAEIESLSLMAQKGYFSQRILSEMAAESGFSIGFTDSGTFSDYLNRFRHDAELAVRAYSGRIENLAFTAPFVTDQDYPLHIRELADSFLNRGESSLKDFANAVECSVNTEISLLPSATSTLDEIFDGVPQEDRLKTMEKLIRDGNVNSEQLMRYDKDNFINASAMIAAERAKYG